MKVRSWCYIVLYSEPTQKGALHFMIALSLSSAPLSRYSCGFSSSRVHCRHAELFTGAMQTCRNKPRPEPNRQRSKPGVRNSCPAKLSTHDFKLRSQHTHLRGPIHYQYTILRYFRVNAGIWKQNVRHWLGLLQNS